MSFLPSARFGRRAGHVLSLLLSDEQCLTCLPQAGNPEKVSECISKFLLTSLSGSPAFAEAATRRQAGTDLNNLSLRSINLKQSRDDSIIEGSPALPAGMTFHGTRPVIYVTSFRGYVIPGVTNYFNLPVDAQLK
jgi:hypothetical protein